MEHVLFIVFRTLGLGCDTHPINGCYLQNSSTKAVKLRSQNRHCVFMHVTNAIVFNIGNWYKFINHVASISTML